uniref:Uncharacterized protein n=1 Tax=Siphoviridae sp. ct1yA16 TaxID=2827767 RepID=A0A8S5TF12_9CAUD|nr:MAG TPA: hypothetical protein [Siphoviridae sp. ct1yA16]
MVLNITYLIFCYFREFYQSIFVYIICCLSSFEYNVVILCYIHYSFI